MRRHRRHSTAFKRRVVEEYHTGASLHALAKAMLHDTGVVAGGGAAVI